MRKAWKNRFLLCWMLSIAGLVSACCNSPWASGQDLSPSATNRSAGQVISVFEEQPQWLEWIASKDPKKQSNPSYSKSTWSSWWGGFGKTNSRPQVSSYRRDNKSLSQRMWISTKRAWNTTTSWLDPYPDPKPESAMDPARKGWFSSWKLGWGEKDEKPSQSVSEFIGQEHPK